MWLCGATTGTKGLRACLQVQQGEVVLCVVEVGWKGGRRIRKVGLRVLGPTSSKYCSSAASDHVLLGTMVQLQVSALANRKRLPSLIKPVCTVCKSTVA